jgi:NitT/TauT family transport system ATP-binding protein
MEGMLELLAEEPFNGRADLPKLAEETELTDAELLEVLNALLLLGFAYLTNGDILLTELGGRYERRRAAGDVRQAAAGTRAADCLHLPRPGTGQVGRPAGRLFLKLLRFTLSEEEAERAARGHRVGPLRRPVRVQLQHRRDPALGRDEEEAD